MAKLDDDEIAVLRRERDAALAREAALAGELASRTQELAERNAASEVQVAHQAATIDVLRVMSVLTGDAQPVFDIILGQAMRLCGSKAGALFTYDGEQIDLARVLYAGADMSDTAVAAHFSQFPRRPGRSLILERALLDGATIYSHDIRAEPGIQQTGIDLGHRSTLAVPLMREGRALGILSLTHKEVGGFTAAQVELVQTFAEQAVIAIGGAANYRALETRTGDLQDRTEELATRNNEFSEQVAHQAATIDVLKVMSSSTSDTQPVFDIILKRATALCAGSGGALFEFDGSLMHLRAIHADDAAMAAHRRVFPMALSPDYVVHRAVQERRTIYVRNAQIEPGLTGAARSAGEKSLVCVPLLRDGQPIGAISIIHADEDVFSEGQIALLETFAEQAVIAIGSVATFRALQDRTAELATRNSAFGERIDQQAATIDVLKVMSASPDDTQPVFDQIVRRARELCNGRGVSLFEYDGELVHYRAASNNLGDSLAEMAAKAPRAATWIGLFPKAPSRDIPACLAILDRQIYHSRNYVDDTDLHAAFRELGQSGGSHLAMPLLRDGVAIGAIALTSSVVGGFSDSQIELLQTFAEQAVIAIGSVATYRALRERTAELTRSVAELQALEAVLRAVNSSLDLETVLATIIARAVPLAQADEGLIYEFDVAEQVFVPKAAFGMSAERVAALRERRIRIGEAFIGRSAAAREPVHMADVQSEGTAEERAFLQGIHAVLAVPLLRDDSVIGGLVIRRRREGGFSEATITLMQTFAAQSVLAIANARLFDDAERARAASEAALADLRRTQDRLVQTEKLASLGQLTAGIAHEIKNPLNFVNNFSDLSVDLLDELRAAVAPDRLAMAAELRAEIDDLTATLKGNLEKIAHHGRRADSIVKNMLQHSRSGDSEHRAVDINAMVEEALNLAYHGARAERPGFNITLERALDPAAGTVELFPQEFTRVILNLCSNGFYAAHKRAMAQRDFQPGFQPVLRVSTSSLGERVEVRVRDNGTGMTAAVRARIFEPFFTTKPTGEGTGLGLSLSHDIIVKQHAGQLTVDSEPDSHTEFTIILPRRMAAPGGATSQGGQP